MFRHFQIMFSNMTIDILLLEMNDWKENETKDVTEEEDATLQEMSLMFAQGEFGKE